MTFRRLFLALVLLATVMAVGATKPSAQIIPMAFWQDAGGGSAAALRLRAASNGCLMRTMTGSPTTWTMSMWFKSTASGTQIGDLFTSVQTTGQGQQGGLGFSNPGGNNLGFYSYHPTPTYQTRKNTSMVFRDPTAWYHVVMVWDTNNAVAEDRARMYINGVRVTSFGINIVPGTQGMGHQVINNGFGMGIGCQNRNNGTIVYPFDGYIADVKYVDAQALDATPFGQFAANGVWVPKTYEGTYNANSFWLKFTEAGATASSNVGFGKDFWNSNYWTTNNIGTTQGASYDGAEDHPLADTGEGNYATFNPLSFSGSTTLGALNSQAAGSAPLSEGALKFTGSNSGTSVFTQWGTTVCPTSGKWYYEFLNVSSPAGAGEWWGVSLLNADHPGLPNRPSSAAGSARFTVTNEHSYGGGNFNAADTTLAVAYDLDAGKAWVGRALSGAGSVTWHNSGNPESGTTPTFTWTPDGRPNCPSAGHYQYGVTTLVFRSGAQGFGYTPPAGFNALSTSNLPAPAVTKPSEYFKTLIYTGNGAYVSLGEPVKIVGSGGYTMNNSARFRSANSAYLSKSFGVQGVLNKWTFSAWVKRGKLGAAQALLSAGSSIGNTSIEFTSANTLSLTCPANCGGLLKTTSATFNDTTNWMHIVIQLDTSQATASQRSRFYINGREVTSFSSSVDLALNSISFIGESVDGASNPVTHAIGRRVNSNDQYFDGYMADVYFLDGTALPADNFGQFDSKGVWVPKTPTGLVYGNNGFHLDFADASDVTATTLGKDAAGSNNWTPNNFTVAGSNPFQFKPTGFQLGNNALINTNVNGYISWNWKEGVTPGLDVVEYTGTSANINVPHNLGVAATFVITKNIASSSTNWFVYHAAVGTGKYLMLDSANGVATHADTYTGSIPTHISHTGAGLVNTAGQRYISYMFTDVPGFSKFGSYTGNGSADGPFVHTGFKPAFVLIKNGSDNWRVLDSARDTYNQASKVLLASTTAAETPSGDCTLDFLANGFKIRSGTNTGCNDSGNSIIYAAFAQSPFKEQSTQANLDVLKGLRFDSAGTKYLSRTPASAGNRQTWTFSAWVKRGKLGTQQTLFGASDGGAGSGNWMQLVWNSGGTGPMDSLDFVFFNSAVSARLITNNLFRDPGTWYHVVAVADFQNATASERIRLYVNGQRITSFHTAVYPATTGYNGQWNSTSPATIGALNYSPLLNYADFQMAEVNSIDGQALAPSAFGETNAAGQWVPKAYAGTYGTNGFHLDFADETNLGKDVAGSNNWTANNFITAGSNPFQFKPSGFQVGNNSLINTNANGYISWNWKEGATPGFDVVSYTGNGTNGRTVAHSLGVAPSMFVVKPTSAVGDWLVYHSSMTDPTNSYMLLNSIGARATNAPGIWGTSASNISFPTSYATNGNGNNYIGYLWSEVPGFSKFGRYTGNGSADGPFVYTGFKPAYILWKSEASGQWFVHDSARTSYNYSDRELALESTQADYSASGAGAGQRLDILSNGFKVRTANNANNTASQVYLYAAFAESPFKEQSSQANLDVLSGLRFNSASSTYLTRTPASAGNRKTWTWSAWVKRGAYTGTGQMLFAAGGATRFGVFLDYANNSIDVHGNGAILRSSKLQLRDAAKWYHVVVVLDTPNATAQQRCRIYVNNVEVTDFNTNVTITQNADYDVNSTTAHYMGRNSETSSYYYNGYLSDIYFVDGQALTPSAFGEANSAGLWAPKTYSGTYGTNGAHLEFLSPGFPGTDTSGNSNTWTSNNIGAQDTMLDSPTNNFATLNPNFSNLMTFADGNLVGGWSSGISDVRSTIGMSSGKWYFEMTPITVQSTSDSTSVGAKDVQNGNYAYFRDNGNGMNRGTQSSGDTILGGSRWTAGVTYGFALDLDAGTLAFYDANVLKGTQTLPTGTLWQFYLQTQSASSWRFNFGQGGQAGLTYNGASGGSFKYTPPTGFKALTAKNLPASLITIPSDYFKPVTYTGNAGTQTVTVGFQPDLTWIKDRTATNGHVLEDSVRISNSSPYLQSNTAAAEIPMFDASNVDLLDDTPTTNFATLNPLASAGVDANFYASKGNLSLTVLNNSSYRQFSGTHAPEGFKGYFEVEVASGTPNAKIGFEDVTKVVSASSYTTAGTFVMDINSGNIMNGLTTLASSAAFATGDHLQVAYDFTGSNKNVWFGRNGVWVSGNPATDTSPSLTSANLTGTYRFYFASNTGGGTQVLNFNFGQRPFAYTPPAGFSALSTDNMPASAIPVPSDYFKAVTYTGNAATQTINVGFQPDLTWIKNRSASANHVLEDSVRVGANSPYLSSNTTAAQIDFFNAALRDDLSDVPTAYDASHGNFATWNPLTAQAGIVLSEGNLGITRSAGASAVSAFGTLPLPPDQKIYFEAKVVTGTSSGNYNSIGIGALSAAGGCGTVSGSWCIESDQANNIIKRGQGAGTNIGASQYFTAGDTVMVAVDQSAGKIWFGRNCTWYGSGNPASGSNAAFTDVSTSAQLFPQYAQYQSGPAMAVNFGQRPFNCTLPSGFSRLQSFNYQNASFVPDLVITKNRSSTTNWTVYDSARGATLEMATNATTGNTAESTGLLSFQNGGFTAGSSAKMNTSGNNYVSYMFKKGVTPGFDIVTYTGNGTNGRTIAHNLGVTPAFYITKNIDGNNSANGWNDWGVYHKNFPTGGSCSGGPYAGWLHNSAQPSSGVGGFCSVPTSSVFGPNQINYDNATNRLYVAYLWAEVPGFSKFGSYVGNGAAEGPFVYTGFKPAFVLIKASTQAYSWYIYDSLRDTYNPVNKRIVTDGNYAEATTASQIDFVANGFKLRNTAVDGNQSGVTYVYAAFAENPFKGSPAR